MAANLQDWDFNRLCDDIEFDCFKVIKSHAKKHTATANPSNCEVCLSLEKTDSGWVACRDALVDRRSQLRRAKERDTILENQFNKLKAEGGPGEAIQKVETEQYHNILAVGELEEEVQKMEVHLRNQEASQTNQAAVKAASEMERSLPMSTIFYPETRKFFLGHFQEEEDNFQGWEKGTFDENLIIDYTPSGQPRSSFSSEGTVDLSPPDGIIGLTNTNALLDFWLKHPQRTIGRRLST